jgi:hypothetical protein
MSHTVIHTDSFDVSAVLEAEFERLHGPLGAEFPYGKEPDERERSLRARVHALPPDDKRTALCLSGGGIRSATFCLGVLQGLAARGELDRFHYLSTVSGGGYIGSWLSSWIRRENGGLAAVMNQLAAPRPKGAPDPQPVRRLRAYSNYLSPVWGMSTDFFTLVATFLRNLVLHWLVLLPLIAAVLMLPRIQLAVLGSEPDRSLAMACLALAAALVAVGIAYVVADLPGPVPLEPPPNRFVACCFVPILAAAVLLSWTGGWHNILWHTPKWYWFLAAGALVHLTGVILGLVWRRKRGLPLQAGEGDPWDLLFVVVSGAAGGGILYLAATHLSPTADDPFEHRERYATLAVPALLGCFWLGSTVYAGLSRRVTSEDDREWWARSGAWWLGASVIWILGYVLVIYGPQWILALDWFSMPGGPQAVGVGGGLLGVATGLIGYWSKNGSQIREKAKGIVAATGLRLLDLAALAFTISLALTLCYGLSWGVLAFDEPLRKRAQALIETGKSEFKAYEARKQAKLERDEKFTEKPPQSGVLESYRLVLAESDVPVTLLLALALLATGIGMTVLIGVNTFSLHSMYGNRLVRAYLGATRPKRSPHWFTGFDPEDNVWMKDLDGGRLFHVVNIALNLVRPSGGRLEWQQRKAASFTVSPLHAGSASMHYVRSASYSGQDGLSLGRAMAISGAAASPNMGYHTSRIVAFVMTVFNIRLGWWLPNPNPQWSSRWAWSEPRFGVRPLLDEALARTTDASPFVYLSDGGHFENLGLYEMVRRRCHRLLVIDAGCDSTYRYEDLENAIRKIRVDFGIPIVFQQGLPAPTSDKTVARRVTVGIIRYSEVDGPDTDGEIVYVKPVLTGDEPIDLARYAASNTKADSPFPHQTTADQFFDEAQFESYRMLGYHSIVTGLPGIAQWLRGEQAGQTGATLPPPVPSRGSGAAPIESPTGGEDEGAKLLDMIQSMGRGALIASALTVGGIVGVSGTVALRDSTVRLEPGAELRINKEDLAELTKPGPSPTPGPDGGASPVVVKIDPALAERLAELSRAVSELSKSIPAELSLISIERRVQQLEISVRGIGGTAPEPGRVLKELEMIRGVLGKINDALVSREAQPLLVAVRHDLDSIVKSLKSIDDSLMRMDSSVQDLGLRQNPRRPSEGGAR